MSERIEVLSAEPYRTSQTVGKLIDALGKAQADMEPVRKNKRNPEKGNKYADLAQVLEECTTALNKYGIVLLQFPDAQDASVSVTTRISLGEEWIDSTLHLLSLKVVKGGEWVKSMDPQGIGSAITYARRYAISSIFAIATEDDDGEKASASYKKNREEAKQEAEREREAVVRQRIADETPRTPAPPPPSVIAEKLRTEPDRYKRLAMFQDLKKEMEAFGGEEGVKAYYQIMKDVGVEHANQFKNLADAIRAGVSMESWIKQRIADNDAKLEAEMQAKDAEVAK